MNWDLERMYRDYDPKKEVPKIEEPKQEPKIERPRIEKPKFDRQRIIDAIKKIDNLTAKQVKKEEPKEPEVIKEPEVTKLPEITTVSPKIISAFKVGDKIDAVLKYKGEIYKWDGVNLQTNSNDDMNKEEIIDWIKNNKINYISF